MREINSSLGHHLNEVAVAQLVGDIPADAENDDCAIKVATTKQGRCVRRRPIHATDYQPDSAFAPEPPEAGRGCHDLLVKLHSFLVKGYVIFYQPTGDGVEIFRVLHGSRDVQGEFDSLMDSTG